jgi:pyruvate kinase
VATEVLHTMIQNKYPTKAEISDITNSVLDGASAIMLSGETAIGNYPIEAVITLAKTIQSVEQFNSNNFDIVNDVKSFAESIASLSHFYGATKIITLTRTGYLPKLLSQVDISLEILAVTTNLKTFRKMKIFRGITPLLTKIEFNKSDLNHVVKILEELYLKKKLTLRDKVLVTSVGYPTSKTKTNTIQILSIIELKRKFDWN